MRPANNTTTKLWILFFTIVGGKLYVHIEIGHAAQNVILQAVSLGLGAVAIGAVDDSAFRAILALPKEETSLYIIPVGQI